MKKLTLIIFASLLCFSFISCKEEIPPAKYSVTYMDGNTTIGTATTVDEGTEIVIEGAPSNEDATKEFAGWTANDTLYQAGDKLTVNADVVLTAKWDTLYSFDITYGDGIQGTTSEIKNIKTIAQLQTQMETIIDSLTPVTEDNMGYRAFIDNKKVTSQTELKADLTVIIKIVDTRTYTVIYDNAAPITVDAGDKIVIPVGPEPANSTQVFTGWKANDENIYQTEAEIIVNANVTFASQWKTVYTVSYDSGTPTIVDAGDKITLAEGPEPADSTQVFLGWKANSETDLYEAKREYTVNANVVFTSQWKTVYTITFDAGKGLFGSSSTKEVKVDAGSTLTLSDTPTYSVGSESLSLDGWIAADGTEYTDGKAINSNITFYAIWKSTWNGTDIDMSFYTDDPSKETFEINTAAQLAGLAKIVNGDGVTSFVFRDKKIKLVNNIDLGENNEWTPIGENNQTLFCGMFDGNNKTIYNLKITETTTNEGFCGFIGTFGFYGSFVKNLTLKDVDITSSLYYIGAIAGVNNDGLIENCSVTGKINGVDGNNCIGGIAGKNYGRIKNCKSAILISDAVNAGGIAADNTTYAGKIFFSSFSGEINNCDVAGGIAAIASKNSQVLGCYSIGKIGDLGQTSKAGGLIGSSENAYIIGSYFNGILPNTDIDEIVNDGNTVEGCYTTATVGDLTNGSNEADWKEAAIIMNEFLANYFINASMGTVAFEFVYNEDGTTEEKAKEPLIIKLIT